MSFVQRSHCVCVYSNVSLFQEVSLYVCGLMHPLLKGLTKVSEVSNASFMSLSFIQRLH